MQKFFEVRPLLRAAVLESIAKNTFLLALDGDVDFQPDAIIKLVDLMKRNPVRLLRISLLYWHIHTYIIGGDVFRIPNPHWIPLVITNVGRRMPTYGT